MTHLPKSKENICFSSLHSFSNCYWKTKINSCLVMFGLGLLYVVALENNFSNNSYNILLPYVAAIPHIHKKTESRDSNRYLNTSVHYIHSVLAINISQKGGKHPSVQQEMSGVDRQSAVTQVNYCSVTERGTF